MAATPAAEPMIRIDPGARAIGQELPEQAVRREAGQVVHSPSMPRRGDVVDDGADDSDHGDDEFLSADRLVEPPGQGAEDVAVLQSCHRWQDADEEHQGAEVDLARGVSQGEVGLEFVFLVPVDQVADQPEDAQAEKGCP